MSKKRVTLAGLETISIPELEIDEITAKVDTGAFSGALHCKNIKVERHDRRKILRFTPLGDKSLATSTHEFHETIVRSANGHESIRYIIPLTLVVQGNKYRTMIGLSDRTVMKRDMLLGRRFLLEHDMLVDVSLSRDIDDEAERIDE